jgi:hypothetical protein
MKYTTRDLLYVTLIVALLLGWLMDGQRERLLRMQAAPWYGRAGALEHLLRQEGWTVEWTEDAAGNPFGVHLTKPRHDVWISTQAYEPSDPWTPRVLADK